MRESCTTASGRGKLEAEPSLGKHNALDLRPEHAARNASEISNQKDIPPRTEKFPARHEANQVGLVCGDRTCQGGVKLCTRNTFLSNHTFDIPLNSSLLPLPIGDTYQFMNIFVSARRRQHRIYARR